MDHLQRRWYPNGNEPRRYKRFHTDNAVFVRNIIGLF